MTYDMLDRAWIVDGTGVPAQVPNIGIKQDKAAEVAIFDLTTVGSDERPERRFDLFGGVMRVVMGSTGIHMTLANGVVSRRSDAHKKLDIIWRDRSIAPLDRHIEVG
jgi:hypothetical protein